MLISEADRSLLERIRHARAMATVEAAAEWLIRTRLRRAMQQVDGRRGMRLVSSNGAAR